jgi:hypothetical protein
VTPALAAHSIVYVPETIRTGRNRRVPAPPAVLAGNTVLTKRRAVDFCLVATAICCHPASGRPAA